jgi:hypothetical protein
VAIPSSGIISVVLTAIPTRSSGSSLGFLASSPGLSGVCFWPTVAEPKTYKCRTVQYAGNVQ